jgi:mannose-6-phosphate isomerase-like protein (cupin superfamily)
VSEVFEVSELLTRRAASGGSYLEFLRIPAMSTGIYELPAGGNDPQIPHHEDEIYYVIRGKAKVRLGSQERKVREGSVIFVEAGLEHRFFNITKELVLLVFFAPPESS